MKVYKYYTDGGHGWLAVKFTDLITLGILQKISRYSYYRGKTAYLEEDRDMSIFFDKYKEKYGEIPHYQEKITDNSSPIRQYGHYPYDCIPD